MTGSSLFVIGSSAGGMDALTRLLAQLPADFPAPLFVVNHMAPDGHIEVLCRALNDSGAIRCTVAKDNEVFKGGHIYLAPADHHLLLVKGMTRITKGARENRSRPGIDPLFRSAAVAYRSKVVGVVLTGYLDDGTAGLEAIHRCGGICIVQDPADAAYPDMPQNALNRVKVDYTVALAQMGALFTTLALRPLGKDKPVPKDIAIEAGIAERILSDLPAVNELGDQVPFNCPDCGGPLWKITQGNSLRYRCHVGHAFTSAVLETSQTAKIEETLWTALRMFEERRNLLMTISDRKSRGYSKSAASRAKESEVHIARIRAILTANTEAAAEIAAE